MAGILRHAPELTLVTNQYVNSYKRLWGGGEAPSFASWGHNNRSALIRVPLHKPEKANSTRIEYRAMDSAANPYLAYALLLAAGLKGIEEGYELPPETEDDVWSLSDLERRAMGIDSLPQSLDHAIKKLEESERAAEVLGESVFSFVLANKRREWEHYRSQVTPFEIEQDLRTL
jgi:glutamine synthetase